MKFEGMELLEDSTPSEYINLTSKQKRKMKLKIALCEVELSLLNFISTIMSNIKDKLNCK